MGESQSRRYEVGNNCSPTTGRGECRFHLLSPRGLGHAGMGNKAQPWVLDGGVHVVTSHHSVTPRCCSASSGGRALTSDCLCLRPQVCIGLGTCQDYEEQVNSPTSSPLPTWASKSWLMVLRKKSISQPLQEFLLTLIKKKKKKILKEKRI